MYCCGMEKLGYQIDKSYENAYLNTWNVIGFLLGIISENMPNNYLKTVKIDKKIAKRQFKQSIESQQLTASLDRKSVV